MTAAASAVGPRGGLSPALLRLVASAALLAVPLVLVGAPLAALASVVAEGEPGAVVAALGRAQVPALALSTLSLAAGATAWALAAALPLAWLTARTDLPLRRVVAALAPLPLAVPPYVAAIAYALLLGPGGSLHTAIASAMGAPPVQVQWPRGIYGNGGAAFVLGLFTAPSLFLVVYGALARANPSLEEAARGLGYGPWRTLLSVTLPLVRPAIAGGALLVFVYACIDFGVVSLLRARTVTTTLYTYLLSGYSRPASAALALGLVSVVWLCLAAQAATLRGAEGAGNRAHAAARPMSLGPWRWLALGYAVLVLGLSLVVPVAVLLAQAGRLGGGSFAAFALAQWPYLARSVVVAAAGATGALLLGALLGLAAGRLPGAATAAAVLQAGYAVPGTVLGLALVGLLLRAVPWAYGTPAALVLAYGILFAAPAYQASSAAIRQVTPALEAAARGLGSGPLDVLRRVVMPLAAPGLVGGWALSFALAFRELAATIIIRPPGYDTLAVRIWVHTMDVGPDPRAATVALILLVWAAGVWLVAQALVRR